MNEAKSIWKNSVKLQMTLFCCCGKIQNYPILLQQMNPTKTIGSNHIKFSVDPILPQLWMNQAKTIWKISLKFQMTLFCHCAEVQNYPILLQQMNPTKTIGNNHIKFAVDPILPQVWMNQAKTIWKNSLKLQMTLICICGKVQNDPILLQQMNRTKTIGNNHIKFAVDPILPLWMNQAKTIWKNSVKLQMTLFCRCGKIQNYPISLQQMNPTITIGNNHIKFAYDPILLLWMNQAKTTWKNFLKFQMTLFYRCGEIQNYPILLQQMNPTKIIGNNHMKFAVDPILPQVWMNQAKAIWKNSLKLQMTLICICGKV